MAYINKYRIGNRFYLGKTPSEAIAKFLDEQSEPVGFKCEFHSRIDLSPRIAPVPTKDLKGIALISSAFSLRRCANAG